MAYSVIQKPGALSLSGNIVDFKISTASPVGFTLKKGSETLLEEYYYPSNSGFIIIKLKDIIGDYLSVQIPNDIIFEQANSHAQFSATFTQAGQASSTYQFYVIKGGVDVNIIDATMFLKATFLTWQPKVKEVDKNSPEYLTYYAVSNAIIYIKAFFNDGSTDVKQMLSISQGQCISFSTRYYDVKNLFENEFSKFEVWADIQGVKSVSQTYSIIDTWFEFDDYYIVENSVGGIDTFRFTGPMSDSREHTISSALFDDYTREYAITVNKPYTKNTGLFESEAHRLWIDEFFTSINKVHVKNGYKRQITITKADSKGSKGEINSYSFTYIYSNQNQLQNLSRLSDYTALLSFITQ